jgi:hypothetical protein
MVPFCLHAVANTPAGRMEFVRSYDSLRFGLPSNRDGSAPALVFSRPAQRSLTLRPARSPGRLRDPLHQRLQQSRCLHCCSDCYRVERTSSRAGLPPLWTITFSRRTRHLRYPRLHRSPLRQLRPEQRLAPGRLWLAMPDRPLTAQPPVLRPHWEPTGLGLPGLSQSAAELSYSNHSHR